MRSQYASTRPGRSSASGARGSIDNVSQVSKNGPDTGARPAFPPSIVVGIKALACELPSEHGLPLSRLSLSEVSREAARRGLVASIGKTTLWRWFSEDAIRPWTYRSWIFPRAEDFREKAGPILDLYQGIWQGQPLSPLDCVLSTDEKTSIQARKRIHSTLAPAPKRSMRVEHEYERCGAWAYMAAWDVRRAKIFGRCERHSGIGPFLRLVDQVMSREPYRSAPRVFWIMDNGSSHRGQRGDQRLLERWPTIVPVHTPVHASWLNQIEIYFSIIQRKVLTPNDFPSLREVEKRLLEFQTHYEAVARPFQWKYTKADLDTLLAKLGEHDRCVEEAA